MFKLNFFLHKRVSCVLVIYPCGDSKLIFNLRHMTETSIRKIIFLCDNIRTNELEALNTN